VHVKIMVEKKNELRVLETISKGKKTTRKA
jgi:hypothetical protein